jgi:hypothetical protein
MRIATFIAGIVSLFLLAGVAYWVFITMQFPAGAAGARGPIVASAERTLASGREPVSALVATFVSWQPRAARWGFTLNTVGWAVVLVVFSSGMLVKMLGTLAPGTGLVSMLFNLLLVASPLLPLITAQYLTRQAVIDSCEPVSRIRIRRQFLYGDASSRSEREVC